MHLNQHGSAAGFNATDASNSNFIGFNAGLAATRLNSQISLVYAGYGATDAQNSNFGRMLVMEQQMLITQISVSIGYVATNAYSSNFFGLQVVFATDVELKFH
jgi:hypothetical protein